MERTLCPDCSLITWKAWRVCVSRKDPRRGWSQGFPNSIRRPVDRGLSAGRAQKTDIVANKPVMNRGSWEPVELQLQRDPWLERELFFRSFQDLPNKGHPNKSPFFPYNKTKWHVSGVTHRLYTPVTRPRSQHTALVSPFVAHW